VTLNVEGLGFAYGGHIALRDVSFHAKDGRVLSVLGPNGVGKTTLLKCLNKIHTPNSGEVHLDDMDVLGLSLDDVARKIAYVAQSTENSRMSVFDSVLLGRKPHISWEATEKDLKVAEKVMRLLGLEDMAMRYTTELSGGEYQLVQIARALAQQPKVILMDEPTSNLDISNQHSIMKLVRNIVIRNGMILINTIHDLNLAARYSDDLLMLKDGSVHCFGGLDVLTSESIYEVYGMYAYVEDVKGFMTVVPR